MVEFSSDYVLTSAFSLTPTLSHKGEGDNGVEFNSDYVLTSAFSLTQTLSHKGEGDDGDAADC